MEDPFERGLTTEEILARGIWEPEPSEYAPHTGRKKKMPKVSAYYPDVAELMKAADLPQPITVKVSAAEVQALDEEEAIVLSFEGQSKKLRLNKTNARALADRFGDETEGWIGKEFILAAVATTYQGQQTKGIRVI